MDHSKFSTAVGTRQLVRNAFVNYQLGLVKTAECFYFPLPKPMCTLIKLSPQQLSGAVNGLRVVINILFDGVRAPAK